LGDNREPSDESEGKEGRIERIEEWALPKESSLFYGSPKKVIGVCFRGR
jgi:hypothetical protein